MTGLHIIGFDPMAKIVIERLMAGHPDWTVDVWPTAGDFLENSGEIAEGILLIEDGIAGVHAPTLLRLLEDDPRFACIVAATIGDHREVMRYLEQGAAALVERPYRAATMLDALVRAEAQLQSKASARSAQTMLDRLSPREQSVVEGMVAGQPNKLIAHALGISSRTVETYRANLMAKLGAPSLAAVVRLAVAAGWTEDSEPLPWRKAA